MPPPPPALRKRLFALHPPLARRSSSLLISWFSWTCPVSFRPPKTGRTGTYLPQDAPTGPRLKGYGPGSARFHLLPVGRADSWLLPPLLSTTIEAHRLKASKSSNPQASLRIIGRRCRRAVPASTSCRRIEHEISRHTLERLISSFMENSGGLPHKGVRGKR